MEGRTIPKFKFAKSSVENCQLSQKQEFEKCQQDIKISVIDVPCFSFQEEFDPVATVATNRIIMILINI